MRGISLNKINVLERMGAVRGRAGVREGARAVGDVVVLE